jgi:hypothetical protein
LQLFDFIEAKFTILIVFEFFLMTAEGAERIVFQTLTQSVIGVAIDVQEALESARIQQQIISATFASLW